MDENTSSSGVDHDQRSISDLTIAKFTEAMNQHAASAVASLQVPEFSGGPNEDVGQFLRRFKSATISLSDAMRCVALNKSLQGSAHIWAKDNIKSLIKGGNWKEVKTSLKRRFGEPNPEIRYHKKLYKLTYDPKNGSLVSFIEEYYDTYRKAYVKFEDAAVITALKLNLPNQVQRSFNVLNDNWQTFTTIKELLELAKRAEEKILPFETRDDSDKLDKATFIRTLNELRDSIEKAQTQKPTDKTEKEKEPLGKEESLALIQHQEQRGFTSPYPTYKKRYEDRQRQPVRPRYGFGNSANIRSRAPLREHERSGQGAPKALALENTRGDGNPNSAYFKYVQKYGEVPGPCFTCSAMHWNKHCPYNLNE